MSSANTLGRLQRRTGPTASEGKTIGGVRAKVDVDAIMAMIDSLEQEIQVGNSSFSKFVQICALQDIDVEIDRENTNLNQLNRKHVEDNVFNAKELEEPSQTSTAETIKELALQKEDSKMKKVIAQMTVMKQIQKKREENEKLELALRKLAERRKIIRSALEKQKQVAQEKRKNASAELQRQMEVMASREKFILNIRNQEKERERHREREEERRQSRPVSREEEIFGKADMLEAHKLLVDKSNQRILSRIEEIKLARRAEAVAEQESFLAEQQLAINLLRQLQLQRDQRFQTPLQVQEKPSNTPPLSQRLKKAKATLLLNPEDKKQVMEWMDLEKNSAILHKTDRAIAEKLRAENSYFDSADDYYEDDYSEEYEEYDDDIDDLLGLKNMENLINSDFSTMLDVEASPSFIDLDFDDDDGSLPISDSNVRTHVKRYPNGRLSTSVSIGIETPRPRIERLKFHSTPRRPPQSFSSLMMSQ